MTQVPPVPGSGPAGPVMSRRNWLAGAGILLSGVWSPAMDMLAAKEADSADLRAIARAAKIPFGAAMDVVDLDRPDMVALFRANCTSITPRNALKWTATEKRRGVVDYSGADKIVAFARANDCLTYGHTLIWYHVPGWVDAITDAADLRKAMQDRIFGAMRHFGRNVYAWDVVNEPLEYSSPQLRDSVFQRLLGEEHIRLSFLMAREAQPTAQLVLNEAHLEKKGEMYDARRAAFIALLDRLLKAGTPVQSVGFQGHFRPGLDTLDPKATGQFCATLKSMGLGVRITELDASCTFANRVPAGTDIDAVYADVFRDMVSVAASNGRLDSVTMWGLAEKYDQSERKPTASCHARVLLYDDGMKPRRTLESLAAALRSIP